jgi:hypothetical protein
MIAVEASSQPHKRLGYHSDIITRHVNPLKKPIPRNAEIHASRLTLFVPYSSVQPLHIQTQSRLPLLQASLLLSFLRHLDPRQCPSLELGVSY